MYYNRTFPDTTAALPELLRDLNLSPVVGSRVGKTRELTHVGITIEEPWRKEILVPGRKANIVSQIAETAWVLAGRDDVDWLAHYMPRARDYSDDGKTWRGAYGRRLRSWYGFDQLQHVVDTLKADPGSRRAVAMLYDPLIDSQPGVDIPCNNWLSFLLRDGALDLHVSVRSNDVMWGWSGINTFEWSTLLEVTAELLDVKMGALHFSVTSFHLYERHWERAERIVRESDRVPRVEPAFASPGFNLGGFVEGDVELLDGLLQEWFQLEERIRAGENVWAAIDRFPEPMLRSWLKVLDWWWNDGVGETGMASLANTRLEAACKMGVHPPWKVVPEPTDALLDALVDRNPGSFLEHAIRTHNEKHAAYGDSWKRRGETLGILANIARKVDRLGGSTTADETSADTAMDLAIYLAKYRMWLDDARGNFARQPLLSDTPDAANELLAWCEKLDSAGWEARKQEDAEEFLRDQFNRLERHVTNGRGYTGRCDIVDNMLWEAYALARSLYTADSDSYAGADVD